jgi:RNA recognition motif-containing protein
MNKKLYVGNLSYQSSEATLRPLIAEYGEIESFNVITDRETGRPRGFAFVEMATQQAAEAAIAGLDGKMVDDRQIKVNAAKPQVERQPGSRSRGGW